MADKTKIEWADATWTPIRGTLGKWHCVRVSPGCGTAKAGGCYAERINQRFGGPAYRVGADTPRIDARNAKGLILEQPLRWRKPRMIFVCSMTDLFLEAHPFEWIAAVFGVMAACPQHTFQVLTKRPERALEFFEWLEAQCREHDDVDDKGNRFPQLWPHDVCDGELAQLGIDTSEIAFPRDWPLPNVWLGVSAENQEYADKRIPVLLQCPAAVHWVSAEPLLGPITTTAQARLDRLDWMVVGGESGTNARPMNPAWARTLRDQCYEADIPFHFKQHGAWAAWEHGNPYSIWTRSTDGQEADRHKLPFMDPERNEMNPGWLGAAEHHGPLEHQGYVEVYQRLGKQKAGRLLDGRLHNGFPEV